MKGLEHLQELDFRESSFNTTRLKQIAHLHSIQVMNLSDTKVNDAAMVYLSEFPNLHALDVSKTKITDDGLKGLRPPKLASLRLDYNDQLTDASLRNLKGLELSRLSMIQTKTTPKGRSNYLKGFKKPPDATFLSPQEEARQREKEEEKEEKRLAQEAKRLDKLGVETFGKEFNIVRNRRKILSACTGAKCPKAKQGKVPAIEL